MANVRVIVAGPVGCGKSAVAGEIEIAMKAIGVPVRFADEREAQAEKNMTHADWTSDLDMYRPTVVLEERIEPKSPTRQVASGTQAPALDRVLACRAAEAACHRMRQWVPQQWLDAFMDAYGKPEERR